MARRHRILIIDSLASERSHLQRLLSREHYTTTTAASLCAALRSLGTAALDAVVIDCESLAAPDAASSVDKLHQRYPACVLVVVADHHVRLIADGDHHDVWKRTATFLPRPVTADTTRVAIARAFELQRLRKDVHRLRDELTLERSDGAPERPPIPGSSLNALERYAILRTLSYFKGATSRAASMLGISARKIQYKLREYSP